MKSDAFMWSKISLGQKKKKKERERKVICSESPEKHFGYFFLKRN